MITRIKLTLLSLFALAFACPLGFRTANAADEQPPDPNSEVGLLIKGADVDYHDVLWRVRAGLTPKQAVEVAQQNKLEREIEAYDEEHKDDTAEDLFKVANKAGLQPDGNLSRHQLIVLIVRSGTAPKSKTAAATEPADADLESMTVADLKVLAASKDVAITADMKKADIIAAIEKA